MRPWLLVTATNIARNRRRASLQHEAALRRIRPDHDTANAAAFERVDHGLVRAQLVAALARLKPQDAALVTMTALDGYRTGEVAGLLGITEGAARVRLHRAHTRLRDLLGGESPLKSLFDEEGNR